MNGSPSQGPTQTPKEQQEPLERRTLAESIDLQNVYQTSTDERKAMLANEINKNISNIRKLQLRYNENPYDNGDFIDFSNCDELITKYGSKENLLRAFFYHLSENDADSHGSVDLNVNRFKPVFNLRERIDAYNTAVDTNTHITNTPIRFDKDTDINAAADENYVIPDNYSGGDEHVAYDIEKVHEETLEKIEASTNPNGQFYTLGNGGENSPGQLFLQYMVYSIQKLEDINSTVGYIAPDGVIYLVKLDDNNNISEYFQPSSWSGTAALEWTAGETDEMNTSFEYYVNEGSQQRKMNEITTYIQANQAEAAQIREEQEIVQPQLVTTSTGEVRNIEQVRNQNEESNIDKKLTVSQIRERINILNRQDKQNPSRLLAMLEMVGLSREFIIGALAADTEVANNELELSLMAVMSAAFTVIFRKGSLPSFITSSNESNNDSQIQYETPNAQVSQSPEVLTLGNTKTQDSIHSKKRTEYQIKDDLNISAQQAVYLAPGTEMVVQKGVEVNFFNNIEGKREQRISNQFIKRTNVDDRGDVIKLTKPALLLRDSLEQPLNKSISFTGHVYYSEKQNFKNFNFN